MQEDRQVAQIAIVSSRLKRDPRRIDPPMSLRTRKSNVTVRHYHFLYKRQELLLWQH